jgi:hypothetical protein
LQEMRRAYFTPVKRARCQIKSRLLHIIVGFGVVSHNLAVPQSAALCAVRFDGLTNLGLPFGHFQLLSIEILLKADERIPDLRHSTQ